MLKPHGSDVLKPLFVADKARHAALVKEAAGLPAIVVSSAAAANAVMLGSGYFTPLDGFMNLATTLKVAREMATPAGLLWPVPIVNVVAAEAAAGIKPGSRVALCDPNVAGNPVLAVQTVQSVEQISDADLEAILTGVFRTTDPAHPGVAAFTSAGRTLLAGPIQVLNYSYFATDFPDTFRTAGEIRAEIAKLGWSKVVAFQTRNPMHRAHEELCKMATQAVGADGVLIHMLLGKLKAGDIPAAVRDAAIRKMVEVYFPPHSVMIAGYGFDMLYAGPREAVLHAIFRQNAGATHFIVGRDHAGVGKYYGPFDAQAIFDQVPAGALKIQIFKADHTAYSKKLKKVVMMRDCPDHKPEDYINLSGTAVRDLLAAGEPLPEEFARPEVGKILMGYYQGEARKAGPVTQVKATNIVWHNGHVDRPARSRLLGQKGCTVWFTGLPSSGKSTIAFTVEHALVQRGRLAYVLDGDNIRHGLNKNLGFSAEDRAENIRRIGEVSKLFADCGLICLTSFVSPYSADRDNVRALHQAGDLPFVEIFVDTPVGECEKRDPKGLYAKARAGQIKGFTGVDDPYEAPKSPELVLPTVQLSVEQAAAKVLAYLEEKGLLPKA